MRFVWALFGAYLVALVAAALAHQVMLFIIDALILLAVGLFIWHRSRRKAAKKKPR
ncbi:TPA: hypothetical protein OMU21_004961 [Klebsiella aerogenes]|nr:hypothetical protein [Klebsiella aerogenes]